MSDKLVLIEWIDPWSISTWTDKEEALRLLEEHNDVCWTAGWIVAETDKYIAVASSTTEATHPQLGDVVRLPLEVIRKVTPLMESPPIVKSKPTTGKKKTNDGS